jgi:xanthine dehydrogenase YagS FAD-binding subunit
MYKITHVNAKTLDEAVAALTTGAKVNAGGTDLYQAMKSMCLGGKAPTKLVNLKKVPGLSYIKEEGGMLKIGALTTLAEIAESSVVQGKWPALAAAAKSVGTPQLRNMGTIAGNIAQELRCWYYRAEHNEFNCLRKGGQLCYMIAGNSLRHSALFPAGGCVTSSCSDTAIPLTALGATVVTTKKSIAMKDFYTALGNVLEANEIIKEIQVPTPAAGSKQAFIRWAERKALDFAEASCCAVWSVSGGNVASPVIVLGAVSPVPVRATSTEALVSGKAMNATLATQAGDEAVKAAQILTGNTGYSNNMGNRWKVQIAKTMVKRALMS